MNDFYKIWFLETKFLPHYLALTAIYIIALSVLNMFAIHKNYARNYAFR